MGSYEPMPYLCSKKEVNETKSFDYLGCWAV